MAIAFPPMPSNPVLHPHPKHALGVAQGFLEAGIFNHRAASVRVKLPEARRCQARARTRRSMRTREIGAVAAVRGAGPSWCPAPGLLSLFLDQGPAAETTSSSVGTDRTRGWNAPLRQDAPAAVAPSALNTLHLSLASADPQASFSGNTFKEAFCLQGEGHLVYGWWDHPERSLHVVFGERPALELTVVVDEGEILSLFVPEGLAGINKVYLFWTCSVQGRISLRAPFLFDPARSCFGLASERPDATLWDRFPICRHSPR